MNALYIITRLMTMPACKRGMQLPAGTPANLQPSIIAMKPCQHFLCIDREQLCSTVRNYWAGCDGAHLTP